MAIPAQSHRGRSTLSEHGKLGKAPPSRPSDLLSVRVFVAALVVLLAGYMFLGRGFAHVGVPPLYVGEVVLFMGLVATSYALVRLRPRLGSSRLVLLLLAFMALGAARTVPYLSEYGINSLRDGVLWGYALFALFIYVLADRDWVSSALRLYGWIVPVFALWLPISWNLFKALSPTIDPTAPGTTVPLVFFKSGDMAVHAAGSVAFLALGASLALSARTVLWRAIIAVPLVWTLFIAATTNRGALLASAVGLGVTIAMTALTTRSWRNWLPALAATGILAVGVAASPLVDGSLRTTSIPAPTASSGPSPTASSGPSPTASSGPSPTASPQTTRSGRQTSIQQLVENLVSIVTSSSVPGLEGTKQFRLRWWGTIVDYTVFGEYFWTGKGFGINLADSDGFQATADRSLRAPHNSHMTVLARMGVPGFILWFLFQAAFVVGLLKATLEHARAGSTPLAAAGSIVLAYWSATMVNTSFDPYLEGPQGGIWYWTLVGLGFALMREARAGRAT